MKSSEMRPSMAVEAAMCGTSVKFSPKNHNGNENEAEADEKREKNVSSHHLILIGL